MFTMIVIILSAILSIAVVVVSAVGTRNEARLRREEARRVWQPAEFVNGDPWRDTVRMAHMKNWDTEDRSRYRW